jgi:hypothetical protein
MKKATAEVMSAGASTEVQRRHLPYTSNTSTASFTHNSLLFSKVMIKHVCYESNKTQTGRNTWISVRIQRSMKNGVF